jgi:4-alpha-glucanotransferase
VNLPRCAGILLHVTSIPSAHGIGDFGPEAFRFVDQLAAAGQTLWQVLPLGPIGDGNSPYQSFSAFAGEPLLISLELLAEEGVLSKDDLKDAPAFPAGITEYERVKEWKLPLLKKAYLDFHKTASSEALHLFRQFAANHTLWLDDYALFVALKDKFGRDKNWIDWDKALVQRNPAALADFREELKEEVECQKYWQFIFYRQWDSLRQRCAERDVRIMGDIPIYVSQDSSDVWAHPKQFLLDSNGKPKAVSGVPPDYFSETGQLWGNPIYNWKAIAQSGFQWWIDRFRGTFRLYDALRVDHFRGFEAYWEVPAKEETAVNGKWVKAPGEKLFRAVTASLGKLEIVAENLGVITPEVEALRRKFNYPGMAILQFAFGIEGNAASYRPHNLEREVVAYTGTHDNDTVLGWWDSGGGDSTRSEEDIRKEKEFTLQYLGQDEGPMNWKMIRALEGSVAQVAIVPMQDVLGLGSESRMNRPGVAEGNWGWRMLPDAFTEELQKHLLDLATVYDRLPAKKEPLNEK